LRGRLAASPGAVVVAPENHGPSVGFRLYDPALVEDPEAEFTREKAWRDVPDYHERLRRNQAYHRHVFLRRGKVGLYTNWIEFATHTDYDERGRWQPLPGEKAVFFNPHTDHIHIDRFVTHLHG
jgi:hypothetical protein